MKKNLLFACLMVLLLSLEMCIRDSPPVFHNTLPSSRLLGWIPAPIFDYLDPSQNFTNLNKILRM